MHPAVNTAPGDCLCVRCFKSAGFLGMVLPLVLHKQLLRVVLLLSEVSISTVP